MEWGLGQKSAIKDRDLVVEGAADHVLLAGGEIDQVHIVVVRHCCLDQLSMMDIKDTYNAITLLVVHYGSARGATNNVSPYFHIQMVIMKPLLAYYV
jgi:hypothetical protein